jgi:hypothetical protein
MQSLWKRVKHCREEVASCQTTFCVEDLYGKSKSIFCPDIADDDVYVLRFSGAVVLLSFGFCSFRGSFIIVRPDLPYVSKW